METTSQMFRLRIRDSSAGMWSSAKRPPIVATAKSTSSSSSLNTGERTMSTLRGTQGGVQSRHTHSASVVQPHLDARLLAHEQGHALRVQRVVLHREQLVLRKRIHRRGRGRPKVGQDGDGLERVLRQG